MFAYGTVRNKVTKYPECPSDSQKGRKLGRAGEEVGPWGGILVEVSGLIRSRTVGIFSLVSAAGLCKGGLTSSLLGRNGWNVDAPLYLGL